MKRIQVVWIEEGCIACGACPVAAPAVFIIEDQDAMIRGAVRRDGITSRNEDELSGLTQVGIDGSDSIIEAAEGCPVEVIKFSTFP